jgi:hypothetical protein
MDDVPPERNRDKKPGKADTQDDESAGAAEAQDVSGTVEGQVPGTQSTVETAQTDEGKDRSG